MSSLYSRVSAAMGTGMRIDAMRTGLKELRDELRALAIEHGADSETWDEQ